MFCARGFRDRFLSLIVVFVVLAGCAQPQKADEKAPEEAAQPVSVKLVGFNDFHGNIEAPAGTVRVDGRQVDAGGVAYMKAHIDQLRAQNQHTVVVAAGDLVGASPLVSSVFHDEPTIEAMNQLGLDFSAVGNHELDEGWQELLRLQDGGCHPDDGCQDGDPFEGAQFQFLAANIVQPNGSTLFPAYTVERYGDIPVAFIGLVLDDAPDAISPAAIEGLTFRSESAAINEIAKGLRENGIESIVVLIHEGGVPSGEQASINDCGDLVGPIVDIAKESSDAVDVFVTGHSHQTYICEIDGKLVTSAMSYGRLITEIDLTLDPATGDVAKKSATNTVVTNDGNPDAEMASLVDRYVELSADLANRPVGSITATISRDPNEAGESAMGGIIADAQLEATAGEDKGDAQIAFMNPGGIRSSLKVDSDSDAQNHPVAYKDLHRVQPFGNTLMTMTLTGQQIHDLLEMQWSGDHPRILQVSEGFGYTWDANGAPGDRIDSADIEWGGEPIQPDGEYRVTVNGFLAAGGDGFTVLTEGTDRRPGPIDLDAFVAYFEANSPVAPGPQDRIAVSE